MDSMWSKFDQVMCATAPLLAATILFACGYIVGRAAKDWYDRVPDYSCCSSESGSDEQESDDDEQDSDDKDSEEGENVSSAGGVTDDSAMEDYVPTPVGSDTEDDGDTPGQELATLIEPIECGESDVEDPFLIDDVDDRHPDDVDDDHLEYEHMDIEHQPPVTDLDYERLDDDTEEENPATEQDDEPPVTETKG